MERTSNNITNHVCEVNRDGFYGVCSPYKMLIMNFIIIITIR